MFSLPLLFSDISLIALGTRLALLVSHPNICLFIDDTVALHVEKLGCSVGDGASLSCPVLRARTKVRQMYFTHKTPKKPQNMQAVSRTARLSSHLHAHGLSGAFHFDPGFVH